MFEGVGRKGKRRQRRGKARKEKFISREARTRPSGWNPRVKSFRSASPASLSSLF